jgi:adenine C2-methylase RlmN of 23S rRNA A2503 and tRNA A37
MSGKVIHISNDIHEKAKQYCKKHKLSMKVWLDNIILANMGEPILNKKVITRQIANNADGDVWTRPPFWANK